MPLLSLITAARGDRADLLAATGTTVAAQRLPPGWELEWLIQEDGANPALADTARHFPFARYQAHREQLGIAATRNLALTRASGDLIRVLDSDDLLLSNALSGPIERLTEHPDEHWVAARPVYLNRDGRWLTYYLLLPAGPVRPGVIGEYVRLHRRCPVHCAGLTMRTGTVRALGGWTANPRAEDIDLLVAVSELFPGHLEPEQSWVYRLHDGQTVHDPSWGTNLVGISHLMIHNRIAATRKLTLSTGERD
jgi:glycosyltransferase involved in cell wall biosynthesis